MQQLQNDKDVLSGFCVILFTSPTCNPCKQMRATIEELEKSHADKANFFEVDTTSNRILSKKYAIKSVPTVVFKKDNKITDRFAGFIDTVDIESKLINLLFGLDEDFLM